MIHVATLATVYGHGKDLLEQAIAEKIADERGAQGRTYQGYLVLENRLQPHVAENLRRLHPFDAGPVARVMLPPMDDTTEHRYVRHSRRPEWGVGVLVGREGDNRAYLFEDGKKRTLKVEFCDRFLEAAPAPESAETAARLDRGRGAAEAAPRAIHLELEQEILRDRDDPGPYLVYADWLQGRDDPRGELITVQHELSRAPKSRKLKQAEVALYKAHGEYLIPGKLDALLRQRRRRGELPCERTSASWFMGFLRSVAVASHSALEAREVAEAVEQILRHPSAHFIQGISVGHFTDSMVVDYRPAVAAIVAGRAGRSRRVVVRCDGTRWGLYAEGALASAADRDLGAVELSGFSFGSGDGLDPSFGHLRRLTYWPAPLATATVEVLAR